MKKELIFRYFNIRNFENFETPVVLHLIIRYFVSHLKIFNLKNSKNF